MTAISRQMHAKKAPKLENIRTAHPVDFTVGFPRLPDEDEDGLVGLERNEGADLIRPTPPLVAPAQRAARPADNETKRERENI